MVRLLMFAALLSFVPLAEALAQTVIVDPAPSSPVVDLLKGFISPSGVATLMMVLGAIFGMFQFLTTKRKRIIADAAFNIFHLVEDIGAQLDGDDVFDKTARYLKEVDAYLLKQGYRPLKPGEIEVVKTLASAQHGFEVAKAKVAIAAAEAQVEAAKPSGPPSP